MLTHSVFGALRTVAHPPCRHVPSAALRALSTRAFLPRPSPAFSSLLVPILPSASRAFSIRSLFQRKPPTPSPVVVARIDLLEAEANTHPNDVQKQLALYHALLETKLPSSYQLIISRWERMCEFNPSSSLLHSADAFKIYLSCLLNTGQRHAIDAAVRRRDSLIAAHPLPSNLANTDPATQTTVDPADPAAPVKPPADSNNIAQDVLSGQAPVTPPPVSTFENLKSRSQQDGGPIQVSIVQSSGSWIPSLIRFTLGILAVSFIVMVMMSVFFENTNIMRNGPKQQEFEPADGKVFTFSDVHGVNEAKEELEDIVAFLKDPSAFAALGGKLPKGVLLTGPPGTGKTLLARAVAGEAGVPFFFASGSDFEEMFVGVGAKRVRELFAAARKKEPSIIFIDELDAVGGKRSGRDQQYVKQTLNQLLTEMDGFMQNESIIVMAATNLPQTLDSALVRPGRFDRIISVPLPDVRGRVAILQRHVRDVVVAPDVDLRRLARGTPGFSGADLQNMVNLAAIHAAKQKSKAVTTEDLEWAKDRIVMGAERRSAFIKDEEKLSTAYHEGGHTLVTLFTPGSMPLHKVTIMPRGHALGITSYLPEDDVNSRTYKQYLADIDGSMGGRAAEELVYGAENVSSGASSDIEHATRVARTMVKSWGFSKLGPIDYRDVQDYNSPKRSEMIEDEVAGIITQSERRAFNLLKEHRVELDRLAHALVEHETLDADQVMKVIKGEPIKDISAVLDEQLDNANKTDGNANVEESKVERDAAKKETPTQTPTSA